MKYLGIVLACIIYQLGISQNACNYQLIGVAHKGGLYNNGSIVQYSPQGGTTFLYNFQNTTEGHYPSGTLAVENNSMVYGTTTSGGNNNLGVIYSYHLELGTYTVLHHFEENTGSIAYGGVIIYNDHLYGTTCSGGSNGKGVLFSFDLSNTTYSVLEDFDGGNNGHRPFSTPVVLNNILYGTTCYGGSNDGGVIYSYDLGSQSFSTLQNFNSGNHGESPKTGLTIGGNGNLYGVCSAGGNYDQGTLFEFDPTSSTLSKKVDFSWYQLGAFPKGKLLQASNNLLYGTCSDGGVNGKGLLFSYDPVQDDYQVKTAFNSEGLNSYAGLYAIDELIYGNTQYGEELGSCFAFDLNSGVTTNQFDHQLNTGYFFNYEFNHFTTGTTYDSYPSICEEDSIFLDGNWESHAGTYTELYTSVGGCDSIIDYHLTITPNVATIDTMLLDTPSGIWVHGNLITNEGTYDSIFASASSCDSTSSVVVLDVTSIDDLSTEPFQLWPNPTTGATTLISQSATSFNSPVYLYNSLGQKMKKFSIESKETIIDLTPYPKGIYYLQIIRDTNTRIIKLIKSK